MFGIPISTIYSIINVYTKESRIESKLKGGLRNEALSGEHVESLKSRINEDASITLQSLKQNLESKFSVIVSIRTIHKYMENFCYTLKRITPIPIKKMTSMQLIKFPL